MNIVDEILDRAKTCFGVNSLPWDRLFLNGDNEISQFFAALIRERAEMVDALKIAAEAMHDMSTELTEIKAAVKASGKEAMELGGE